MTKSSSPKLRTTKLAEAWEPKPDDPYGDDKKRLIRYLLKNNVSSAKPRTINSILSDVKFSQLYRRESFQHSLLGPLRRDPTVFIGVKNNGIFLVQTPEDVDATLGFYTWRIRAELRHARNLRGLARRTKLMKGFKSSLVPKKERAVIYLDESGTPDVKNLKPPVLVIGAIVIDSRKELSGIEQRFKNAFAAIGRPQDHELKTSGLSVVKHARVLHELSLLQYQWAAACFDKRKLKSAGFNDPKTFYKYALQFLIGDLLTIAWEADVVIDESSTPEFQSQIEDYLRDQNSGLPVSRLGKVKFTDSSKNRIVQLADLIAGAVRRSVDGEREPLDEIQHQQLTLQYWPPRAI